MTTKPELTLALGTLLGGAALGLVPSPKSEG